MEQKQFSIWQTLKISFHQTIEHLGLFLAVTVLQLALSIALVAAAALWMIFLGRTVPIPLTIGVMALLGTALIMSMGWFSLAWTSICLEIEAHDASSMKTVWDCLHKFPTLRAMTLLTLIFGILRTILFCLLIVPGIWFDAVYSFAFFYLVERHASATTSLKASAQMTKGIRLKLMGLFAVLALIEMIGHMTVIGGLLVAPWITMAALHVYRIMTDNRA